MNYDFAELEELAHAYAVTIHRSQGSEYPAVVIPLTTSSWMMLQRNLLNTGITRAKKLIILAGPVERSPRPSAPAERAAATPRSPTAQPAGHGSQGRSVARSAEPHDEANPTQPDEQPAIRLGSCSRQDPVLAGQPDFPPVLNHQVAIFGKLRSMYHLTGRSA